MGTKLSAWIVFLFLFLALPGAAQTRQAPSQRIDPTMTNPEVDENRDRLTRDMAKKANQERQAALKNDTEKLVKLAGELKDYVDKSNENTLSLNVLKKAEEIEKLARSVKEKMKGAN